MLKRKRLRIQIKVTIKPTEEIWEQDEWEQSLVPFIMYEGVEKFSILSWLTETSLHAQSTETTSTIAFLLVTVYLVYAHLELRI